MAVTCFYGTEASRTPGSACTGTQFGAATAAVRVDTGGYTVGAWLLGGVCMGGDVASLAAAGRGSRRAIT